MAAAVTQRQAGFSCLCGWMWLGDWDGLSVSPFPSLQSQERGPAPLSRALHLRGVRAGRQEDSPGTYSRGFQTYFS